MLKLKFGLTSALVTACITSACVQTGFAASYTLTTLATFTGSNGSRPDSTLMADGSGNLYGTTWVGGAGTGAGSVFEVAAGTRVLSTLASFSGTNGSNPYTGGVYADSSGNIYGTTNWGGDLTLNSGAGCGTVFEIAAGSHTATPIVTFNGTNGTEPIGGLVADKNGNLYGTTYKGGGNSVGVIYEIAAGTHAFSTVATFDANNSYPQAGLIVDSSGDLFGTTYYGGTSGVGTVFEVVAGTHTVTTLASFNGNNGSGPGGKLLVDKTGNLYGTTVEGGAYGLGTVFEVAASNHALTALTSFDGTHGSAPNSGVIADLNGNLYGTTPTGGANGYGTIYEVAAGTHALTTMVSFNNTNGANPYGGLIADAGGNLYGTTNAGGTAGDGLVYEVSGTSFVTGPAALFNASLASYPQANVIGTTDAGHLANLNVVWFAPPGGDASGGGGYYISPIVDLNTTLASANRGSVGLSGDIATDTTRPKFVMLWVDSADEAAIYAKLATLLGTNGLLAVEDATHTGTQWLTLTGQTANIVGYKDANPNDTDANGKYFNILLEYGNSATLVNFSWDFSSIGNTAVLEAIGIVPEPATLGLLSLGILALATRRRR